MRLGCLAFVVSLLLVPAGRADQIITGDENYRRVEITGFENGDLLFRTPDRQKHRAAIIAVRQLVVGAPAELRDLNEAEEYWTRGEPAQAIPRYERALRVAADYWPEVIRVRLLQARDRAGQFEKVVPDFIAVAERMPMVAMELIPRCIPEGASAQTTAALKRIDEVLGRPSDAAAGTPLKLLRYAICRQANPPEALRMAPEIASLARVGTANSSGAGQEALWTLRADAMERLLGAGQFDEAIAGVESAIVDAPPSHLPALLLIKGRALYATATDESDYIRAGWAFMRVVIHCEDNPRAGEALVWAARVHEKIGRPHKAAGLLREALRRSDLSDGLREEARTMLGQLGADSTAASSPAPRTPG